MRGLNGPPRAPTKSGPLGRQLEGAERNIIRDHAQDLRQHRHHAGLAAFAGDGQARRLFAATGMAAGFSDSASEMRRPEP